MGKLINKIILLNMKFFALAAAVAARHHHHHHHEPQLLETMEAYEAMNEDQLLVSLQSKLNSALSSESRGDGDAPLPRPLPSRTSKKLLPLESSRDSMTDNHSSKSQKDEGHRRHAAIDQRYGEKT